MMKDTVKRDKMIFGYVNRVELVYDQTNDKFCFYCDDHAISVTKSIYAVL